MGSHMVTRREARMLIQNGFDPSLTVKIVRNFRLNKLLLPRNNAILRRRMSCHVRTACRPIAERRISENIRRNLDTMIADRGENNNELKTAVVDELNDDVMGGDGTLGQQNEKEAIEMPTNEIGAAIEPALDAPLDIMVVDQMADGGENNNAEEATELQPNAFNGLVMESNVEIINEANNIALNETMGPLNAMMVVDELNAHVIGGDGTLGQQNENEAIEISTNEIGVAIEPALGAPLCARRSQRTVSFSDNITVYMIPRDGIHQKENDKNATEPILADNLKEILGKKGDEEETVQMQSNKDKVTDEQALNVDAGLNTPSDAMLVASNNVARIEDRVNKEEAIQEQPAMMDNAVHRGDTFESYWKIHLKPSGVGPIRPVPKLIYRGRGHPMSLKKSS